MQSKLCQPPPFQVNDTVTSVTCNNWTMVRVCWVERIPCSEEINRVEITLSQAGVPKEGSQEAILNSCG
jgi:hypothetical protein